LSAWPKKASSKPSIDVASFRLAGERMTARGMARL
jgi:hypothetical protein